MATEHVPLPDVLVRYHYVRYVWPKSLRQDPLARDFFAAHVLPDNLHSLLAADGSPLTLYIATLASSTPELFLSGEQCATLRSHLAELMGPTRAAGSWDLAANRPKASFPPSGITPCVLAGPADVRAKLAELQVVHEAAGIKAGARELDVVRRVYAAARAKGGEAPAEFFALDVETWEMDHAVLTEFGWSKVRYTAGGERVQDDAHVVIEENAQHRNGKYCPDARDNYDGITQTMPKAQLLALLTKLFTSLSTSTPLFLILHDHRSDLVSLGLLGVDIRSFQRDLVAFRKPTPPTSGVWVLDTQTLFAAWKGEKRKRKLELCCTALGLPTASLHNAGNDARYTLEVYERLMDPARLPSMGE